jgi:sugar/nucleoside kinase (ribokinase family)
MANHDLIVVGDVMLDVLADPPVSVRPGGSATNAAVAAARAGARVLLVGRIGDDAAGATVRDALAEARVETRLAVDPTLPTGSVVYSLAEGSASAERGANRAFVPEDVGTLRAGAILVSGYALLQDGSSQAARAALAGTAALRAVDVASPGLARGAVERLLDAGANAVLADEEELEALEEGVDDLQALFRLVAVKRGPAGATVTLDGVLAHAEPPVRVKGTAPGTGDAFGGVLLAKLARGASLEAALAEACAAGASLAAARG